jgi:hypothetical protein
MRLIGIGFAAVMLVAVACGGGGGGDTQEDGGVTVPEPQTGSKTSPAAADFSCVGSSTDCSLPFFDGAECPPPATFTVSGEVQDFQSKENIVTAISSTAVATVTVYETTADVLSDTPLAGPVDTDSDGRYSLTIPKSLTRVIFKTTMASSMDTYQFDQLVRADQTDNDRYSVAVSTGDFINAWVGVAFDKSKGAIAGALRDCKHLEVANAVGKAIDPSTSAEVIPDSQIFYFNDAAGLPVKRTGSSGRSYSDFDGRILFLNVPPTESGVTVQAFVNLAGIMTLVSEGTVPVLANSIIIAELDPLGPAQ